LDEKKKTKKIIKRKDYNLGGSWTQKPWENQHNCKCQSISASLELFTR